MSDFYKARCRVHYVASGDDEPGRQLCEYGRLLAAEPTREWNAERASYNLIASDYGLDIPTGNARLTWSMETLVVRDTVAQLERYLRRLEIELNTRRAGKLHMAEAYQDGAPTLLTTWDAVVESCTVRRLASDDAPALPGAWGAVEVSFILTNPKEL